MCNHLWFFMRRTKEVEIYQRSPDHFIHRWMNKFGPAARWVPVSVFYCVGCGAQKREKDEA